jgi:ribosomal protein L29
MKKNEYSEFKNKNIKEIEKKVFDLKKQLTTAYLNKKAMKLTNVSLIKNLKRDVAMLKTLLTQKKLEEKIANIKE